MAFTLYLYDTENNYNQGFAFNLTNGQPFKLERFEEFGGAPVVRLGQSGPLQQGRTDLGYRLQPRTLRLTVTFVDGTNVLSYPPATDTREILHSVVRPSHTAILRAVRDDGSHRILQCYVEQIEIGLLPEHYPARLNRATITLRAANPLPYNPTVKTVSYAGTSEWWTGNGAIGTANVMERTEYPAQGQSWTYQGTITGAWTIAFRSGSVPVPGSGTVAIFHAGTGNIYSVGTVALTKDIFVAGDSGWHTGGEYAFLSFNNMWPGTANYILYHDGSSLRTWIDGANRSQSINDHDIAGTTRRWRSDRTGSTATYFAGELPMVAVYNIALDSTQRTALNNAMNYSGTATETGTITAVNAGDLAEYPLITLTGPIANPVLTNVTTGDVVDLTGLSIGAGQVRLLDLRGGDKRLVDNSGVNRMSALGSAPLGMASFGLAPAPIASGGTNQIRVQGGSMTADTRVQLTYYDRYMGF